MGSRFWLAGTAQRCLASAGFGSLATHTLPLISSSWFFSFSKCLATISVSYLIHPTSRCSRPNPCSRLLLCAKVAPTGRAANPRRYAAVARFSA